MTSHFTMHFEIKVDELDCMDEVKLLRGRLDAFSGIEHLEFDVVRGIVQVTLAEGAATADEIVAAISALGMTPHLQTPYRHGGEPVEAATPPKRSTTQWDWWVGGLLLVAGLTLQKISGDSWIEMLAHSEGSAIVWPAAVCYVGTLLLGLRRIVPRAWASVKQRRADMFVLMCLAAFGALLIREWLEAAVVTWLFVFALLLESRSVRRAREAIGDLLNLTPPQAQRWSESEGQYTEVPVEQVVPGDRIRIRPGDRVSLDGKVLEGQSDIDQAPITGEFQPASKSEGAVVYAGTINLTGTLVVQVTRPSSDSTVSKIVQWVRQAQQQRGASQRWVDRFAEVYTPGMLGLSMLMLVAQPLIFGLSWSDSLYNALVILVIACPCALVISTPVTIVAGLTQAAKSGVLIKSGEALERLADVDAMLFDKTGTLTTGQPRLDQLQPWGDTTAAELLRSAAQLEQGSSHPIAQSLLRVWEEQRPSDAAALEHEATEVVPGGGLQSMGGEPVLWIGNPSLARQHGIDPEWLNPLPDQEASRLWVGRGKELLGWITLVDTLRPESQETMDRLRAIGIHHLEMLTGDTANAARNIALQLRLEHWQAEQLPQDKAARVQELTDAGHRVCMIGDGINDSVALAAAHVSFAMGQEGADVALEAADVALIGSHLDRVPWTVLHAQRALKIVRQNVTLALGTKGLFFLLAATGWATLWMAIVADMGTSLVVIANALRILRPPVEKAGGIPTG
jgi:Cd2+/Zn2+-exporting ATPase